MVPSSYNIMLNIQKKMVAVFNVEKCFKIHISKRSTVVKTNILYYMRTLAQEPSSEVFHQKIFHFYHMLYIIIALWLKDNRV